MLFANKEYRDSKFIEEYEERIYFLKMAILCNCPLSLFCTTFECPFHCRNNMLIDDWGHLSVKYDSFRAIFSRDGTNNMKSLDPSKWHIAEAKVIFFLIKNKHRSKFIKVASSHFSLSTSTIDKIHYHYNLESRNYLALPSPLHKSTKEDGINLEAIKKQCGSYNSSSESEDYVHISKQLDDDGFLIESIKNPKRRLPLQKTPQTLCQFYSDFNDLNDFYKNRKNPPNP